MYVHIFVQIASEEAITDIAYANGRQEFAYSSADKLIYIRKFCIQPSNWRLLHVLQGICSFDGGSRHYCNYCYLCYW